MAVVTSPASRISRFSGFSPSFTGAAAATRSSNLMALPSQGRDRSEFPRLSTQAVALCGVFVVFVVFFSWVSGRVRVGFRVGVRFRGGETLTPAFSASASQSAMTCRLPFQRCPQHLCRRRRWRAPRSHPPRLRQPKLLARHAQIHSQRDHATRRSGCGRCRRHNA